jgi:hypothetical protein
MPAFSALAAALTTWLISAGLPSALATIGGNLIAGGVAAVASRILSPKPPGVSAPNVRYQAVINQAAAERVRGYGKAKLGGPRAFFDSKDGRLHQVIMLHTGEIEDIDRLWIGDVQVTTNAIGEVQQNPFIYDGGTRAWILTRLGTDDQLVYSNISDNWPTAWTDEHQLNGIATLYARFGSPKIDDFQRVFPESYSTQVRAECRLSKVYNPLTRVTDYSDIASLCIADYLWHDDGMPGVEFDDVDWPSVAEFTTVCVTAVPKKNGTSEPRYRLWGVYSLQDEPKAVLDRMARTCDAELYLTPEGRIGIRGGVWTEPTVTIGANIVTGYDGFEQGSGRFVTFNELKIIYTDQAQDYQPTEADPWIDYADQDIRGQIRTDFEVDMVPSASQARRLAKIYAAKANPRWRGTIRTDLRGIEAIGERIIRLVLPELGIDQTFLIQGWSLMTDLTGCTFDLVSLDASAYAWNPDAEEGETSPPPVDTSPDPDLPVPVFADYSVEEREFTAGTSAPVILAEFGAEASRDDLTLEAQVRLSPDGPWEDMSIDGLLAISGPVVDGEDYDIRAHWRASGNSASDWSDPETVTVSI